MLRRPFLIAAAALAAAFAAPALAANPQVEFDTTAGKIKRRALSRRRAQDGRELPRLRQSQALRRHAVPSRDLRLHGPGRRLHARFQAEAHEAAGRDRSRAVEQGRPHERSGHARDGAHRRSQLGDRAVLHQRRRQQVPELPLGGSAGLRLHRVRQGRRGHGRRRQDRQGADRRRRPVPEGRSRRKGHHQQGGRRRRRK